MATKKDLIEAQGFSRRRLLSAFTGGAPGGKELEPAQPLRAVVVGVALTALLVLVGVFYGLVRPGLPTGWQDNHLILSSDTGARYVSIKSTLYPVINTASARLLIPSNKFAVITTDQKTLAGVKIGSAIGILGAPDHLPAADSLVGDGWTACATPSGSTSLTISATSTLRPGKDAAVVSEGKHLFIITGGLRFEVGTTSSNSILRAVGLDTATVVPVDGRWLDLFAPGTALVPIVVAGAGTSVGSSGLVVGQVVHPQGTTSTERYLVTAEGQLAPLGALAYQLYLLGTGASAGAERDVSPAEIASLPTARTPAGGADWPTSQLTPQHAGDAPCAVLTHSKGAPVTGLAASSASVGSAGVHVANGSGAIVRAGGSATSGLVSIVDQTGTAFSVPGATKEIVARLGYTTTEVSRVPNAWMEFMPVGPALTEKAAGSTPKAIAAPSTTSSTASSTGTSTAASK